MLLKQQQNELKQYLVFYVMYIMLCITLAANVFYTYDGVILILVGVRPC